MFAPLSLLRTFRSETPLGLVLATALSTSVFAATPLILPEVVDRFDVGAGTAGLYSTAQLGAFVIATSVGGRLLRPSRGVFVLSLALLAAANVASAITATFAVLVAVRFGAGLALGVLTWLAWSQVFGDDRRQGDIAVIGPLAGVVVSPLFGLLLQWGDDRHLFLALGAACVIPALRTPAFHPSPPATRSERHRATRQAGLIILALSLITLGGSAVFVFGGVIAVDEVGMDPLVVSLVFAANAMAGIPSARYRGGRPLAGLWMILTATCAVVLGLAGTPAFVWVSITVWGFAFWAGIPGIYSLLAERSAYPAERAGDAQAAMAAGRAVGPLLGAAVVNAGGFAWLGVVGGAVMATGAVACVAIEMTAR